MFSKKQKEKGIQVPFLHSNYTGIKSSTPGISARPVSSRWI